LSYSELAPELWDTKDFSNFYLKIMKWQRFSVLIQLYSNLQDRERRIY